MPKLNASRSGVAAIMAVALLLVPFTALASPLPVSDSGASIERYARYAGQSRCSQVEQPGVVAFRSILQAAYAANGGGILRSCSSGGVSEHKEGRAYDWMVRADGSADRQKVEEVFEWLLATDQHGNAHAMARRLGIMYIIWDHQWWSSWRPEQGWQPYTGANPHTDHVHFSFSWAGALQETSFWDGTTPQPPYPDVPRGSYYAAPVVWMEALGITTGYGTTGRFEPHETVTRAQMSAFLWRTMDSPTGSPAHGFPDVPFNAYYEQPVRWLKANDITQGVSNTGLFMPHRQLTRGEMAEFLWRVAGRPGGAPQHSYPDVNTDRYFNDAVSWMAAHAITTGYGDTGRFEPDLPVTRAQLGAFLHRLASTPEAWSSRPPRTALL